MDELIPVSAVNRSATAALRPDFPESGGVPLWMDASVRPDEQVRRLHQSLESGTVPTGELYTSPYQASKWLAVHETWSPARQCSTVQDLYDTFFEALNHKIQGQPWALVSLGCGGGQKEDRCLKAVRQPPEIALLLDISPTLAMVSYQRVSPWCLTHAGVIDLEANLGQPNWCHSLVASNGLGDNHPPLRRVLFFLGLLPNLPITAAWSLMRAWTTPGDYLVVSANLASEEEIALGLPSILPQYDNRETREWIAAFFELHGLQNVANEVFYKVEPVRKNETQMARIRVEWQPKMPTRVELPGLTPIIWKSGQTICAFESLRMTTRAVESLASDHNLALRFQKVDPSMQEGVFLFERT